MDRRHRALVTVPAEGGASIELPWYLTAGVASCRAAYAPVIATDLAESYVNIANPGINNAYTGVAPTFSLGSGWVLNGTTKYLKTGIVVDRGCTVLCCFKDANTNGNLFGTITYINPNYFYFGATPGTANRVYGAGQQISVVGGRGYGVMAVAGQNAFLNGSLDGIMLEQTFPSLELFIGARNFDGAPNAYANATIESLVVYDTPALTAAQVWDLSISMAYLSRATLPGIIFEGDSMTVASPGQNPYPNQCVALINPAPIFWNNIALSGDTMHTIATSEGAVADAKYNSRYTSNVAVIWAGTNDLGTVGASGVDTFADLITWCAARKATGFKTVVLTIAKRDDAGWSAGKETERLAYNALINAGNASIDEVADIASLPNLADPNNTTYFVDKLHLTNAGYADVAALVATKI